MEKGAREDREHIRTLKLSHSCHLGSVQKPVVECLIAEGNAAKLLPAVDVPGPNTHSDLLGLGVFLVTLTHSQQYSWRGCEANRAVRHSLEWILKGEV